MFTVPNHLGLQGRMLTHVAPGRIAAVYPVRQSGGARAGFLFRRAEELVYDHRDLQQQRRLLREAYAADAWEVPRLLAELDDADDFYFDSISQIRMPTWSSGRVTLVGDAGYSPGPAVGGGTSVAMVGAYVLAGELREANGDHTRAFPAYERQMRAMVEAGHRLGPAAMRTLIPQTRRQAWLLPQMMRLVPRLPRWLQYRLGSLQSGPARVMTASTLKNYDHAG